MAMEKILNGFFDRKKVDGILYGIEANHSNRLKLFIDCANSLTDQEFWYGFRIAYESTDGLSYIEKSLLFNPFFMSNIDRPCREFIMTERERGIFNKLPKKLKLYRAMTKEEYNSGDLGHSWTLSKRVAKFFTVYRRNADLNKQRFIFSIVIDKSFAIGFFEERNEKEILLHPEFINHIS